MSSDDSDEELERVVRRAVRSELRVLGERLFWTLLAFLGMIWGLWLAVAGVNGSGGVAVAFVVFGIALFVAATRALLLKWELPPYRPEDGPS